MNMTRSVFRPCARVPLSLAALCSVTALGQTIPNPSFEANTFATAPGYISDNTAITGWTATPDTGAGINPAGGANDFANNGAVPDGANVAFLSMGSTLSTTISGLTAGKTYKLEFRANANTNDSGTVLSPVLRVNVDGSDLLSVNIYGVGASSPYPYIDVEFTAAAATAALTLANDAGDDSTLLLDNFKVAVSSGKWSVAAWAGDEDSGVDASYVYTHAYNFGSGAGTVINGIPFTGVAGGNPRVTDKFNTVFFGNVYNGDANSITGNGAVMAADFVYGGTVPAGSFQTISLSGLTPGADYVLTIFSIGWESPGSTIRWATASVGEDRLTINQDQFDNNNGIRFSCQYTADASGGATVKIAPVNPANVSVHCYGFCNREAVSRNVAPVISQQPSSTTVSLGVPVQFSVLATGFPAPTYRWRFNGAEVAGATTPTLAVAQASAQTAGKYDVIVANSMGSVTSIVARLTVGIAMTNPSFEEDVFSTWPGYVSGNFPITGWASPGGQGINPVEDGRAPFADNGIIPNGAKVAFMQEVGALSQTVSGLTVGAQYYVHYYENARNGGTPGIEVKLGGATLIAAHPVTQVGSGFYHEVFSDVFSATAAETELAFVKSVFAGADTTALIDNVSIVPVAAGTAPVVTVNPVAQTVSVGDTATFTAQGIGSLAIKYQWLKNATEISGETNASLTLKNIQKPDEADYSARVSNDSGTATTTAAHLTVYEPIPDLFNTGVDDKRAPLEAGAVDPHYRLIVNPDTSSPDAIVEAPPGAWYANDAAGKWIGPQMDTVASVVGNFTYRTYINLADRDPSTLVIKGGWATDNTGLDILVNGVSLGLAPNTTQFASLTPFEIYGTNVNLLAGTNTIDFVVANEAAVGYTGLRVQIYSSNLKIPAGVPPEILTHPVSQEVSVGDTVTMTASARGTAPLSYQWNKNGAPIAGQNTLTLTLVNVTTDDSGAYTITVSNGAGTAVSSAADLCVCRRPIPGVFGTGLDAAGVLLGDGAVDPHYTLTVSPDPNYPGPDAITVNNAWPIQAGVWLLNGPNSRWISPQASQAVGNEVGDYTYHTSFDLTGYDLSQVSIVGGWTSDNTGLDILVNGASAGITNPGNFGALNAFTLTTGLVAGPNTVDFVINNAGDAAGPTGLRVDLKGYLRIPQAVKPTLTIKRSGAGFSVSWAPTGAGQKLQSAPAVSGPWTEITGAANPYVLSTPGTVQFFRVVAP